MALHPAEQKPPGFAGLTNLACASQGARVLFATDEWFAPAKMFLEFDEPVFKEGLFTDFGKWMDGWESRRRRSPGHDWCVVELCTPGVLRGFHIDTAFFTGNNVPAIGITACNCPSLQLPAGLSGTSGEMGSCASSEDIARAEQCLREATEWHEVLSRSALGPGYPDSRHNFFPCKYEGTVSHIRVNYYPDGGVARLRAYGEVRRDLSGFGSEELLDFAASMNGGAALAWSNAHYGVPRNCISSGRARKMDEGWETARNPRRPAVLELGPDGLVDFSYARDWFVLKLGARCSVEEVELDTNHFKGNFPESCLIEGIDAPALSELPVLEQMSRFGGAGEAAGLQWQVVVPRTKCRAHEQRLLTRAAAEIRDCGPVTHLRVTIFPDGGLSRVRVRGRHRPATEGARPLKCPRLDAASDKSLSA